MTSVADLISLVHAWNELPKSEIAPVQVTSDFAGCGFVRGVTCGWRVNPRVSLVMQDDDVDKTYLCIVLDNHPVATIRWHAERPLALDVHGHGSINLMTDPMTWPVEVRKMLETLIVAHKKLIPKPVPMSSWERLKEYFR